MTKDRRIYIKNIFYMLAYAFDSLGKPEYEDLEKENFENAQDLFAWILSVWIGQLRKKGFHREYVRRQEDLTTIRGKIDMPGSIRNKIARKQTLSCRFDELSENNILNQILKTTSMLLIRHGEVSNAHKDSLKTEMHYFTDVDVLEPSLIQWPTRFQRNTEIYRLPIGVCKMVLQDMLLTTEKGDYRLMKEPSDLRMCRLYEKFILNYYAKHHSCLKPKSKQLTWALDADSENVPPTMQTDVYLEKGEDILIIDAKYYNSNTQVNHDKHSVHSGNLYQILTYVKNCQIMNGKRRVSGMLLYAKTDEDIQPNEVYKIHGNQISVKTLDLNTPFNELARQLDGIAMEYFGW